MTWDVYACIVIDQTRTVSVRQNRAIHRTTPRLMRRLWKGGIATKAEAEQEASRLAIQHGVTFVAIERKIAESEGDDGNNQLADRWR
jgi:hypothetical protein